MEYCKCRIPTVSDMLDMLIFGAVKCAKCGLPIEAIGQKGCGE